ncbi:DEAD/DEAH box helicase [Dysgonomonas termitidis]
MEEKLIISIIEHPLFGYLLQPLWARREKTDSLTIVEIAGEKAGSFTFLPQAHREIVALAGRCTAKSLMKSYSKETTVSGFEKNVTEKTIETYIRPAIERYQQRIIERLPQSGLEVYFREGVKVRALFDSAKAEVYPDPARAVFNFIKNGGQELRYFITLAAGNEIIDLNGKPFGVICSDPACVFVDRKLLVFKDIDAKKLLPFFSKEYVTVPPASEKAYIEKFIANCLKNNVEVNARGIDIQEIYPPCTARLTLTNGLDMQPVLSLDFLYEGKACPIDTPDKKVVYARQADGTTALVWFYRDKERESSLIKLLTDNGLERKWLNGFRVKQTEPEDDTNGLIDWIQAHREILGLFDLVQDIPDKRYFLGEISLENKPDESPDWFDVKSEAVFGTFRIPFIRFRNHILNDIREYVLPDGSIAVLPGEWFSRYYELMFFGREDGANIRLQRHHFRLAGILDAGTHKPVPEIHSDGLYPVPEGLNATLRPYQHKGFSWLLSLSENNFGGCLADDMGLGKTLQAITLLQYFYQHRKKEKPNRQSKVSGQLSLFTEDDISQSSSSREYPPSLVVVPASLLYNWQHELERFAPARKVYIYSGGRRMRTKDTDMFFSMFDVVLTTYGTLRIDIEMLECCSFHYFILDESQYVKNPDSVTYKAVMRIKAMHKLALTGTPVENSLTDLWAQFNIVNTGMLGNLQDFRKAYANPLRRNNKEKEAALLKIIQPFILRRTKAEVAPELPPLTEKTVYCNMSESQAESYNLEKNKLRNSLIAGEQSADTQKLSFMALQGLTRLRLLANHPKLLDLSYCGDSGKFEQVAMYLETLRNSKHKVLVFSSFVKHLRLFSGYFDQNNWKYAWLTGDMKIRDREKQVDLYMHDPEVNCFFISIKAGGVGLNLTAADYVLILDPWWNPAVENQAVSRSHRIGQQKHVIAYRFISSGTVEEKIRRLQDGKSKLAEVFASGSNPLQGMDKDDVEALLE